MVNLKWNENMPGWDAAAKEHGIDLSCFEQDKILKQKRLIDLGLPVARNLLYQRDELKMDIIDELFSECDWFCRLIPKHGGDRPWRLRLKSRKEFEEFISQYDLSKYMINLGEKRDVSYTGAIISHDDADGLPDHCIAEIAPVDGHEFFHGKVIPIHAEVGPYGRVIHYTGLHLNPSVHERSLVRNALRWIGGPRHPLPGYFEFEVWGRWDIRFRNYQPQDTAYARL